MITTIKLKKEFKLISQMSNESRFQIFEHEYLSGSDDVDIIIKSKKLLDAGVTLKQVRVILDDSAIKINNEMLSYIKGDIVSKKKTSNNHFWSVKNISEKNKKQVEYINTLEGQGEVLLKPNLGCFTLIELEDEEIIIDEELFCVCEDTIEVTKYLEKNVTSILQNNSGIPKIKLNGSGIVTLKLDVPEDEVMRVKIFKDNLYLNDEVEILRTNTIKHNIENLNNNLNKNNNDEKFLIDAYKGTGELWILPTRKIYDCMGNENCYDELAEEDYDEIE